MGTGGARRATADVTHRRGATEGERRQVAIYVRIDLDDSQDNAPHRRYALETLLSTIGVPFRFAAPDELSPTLGTQHPTPYSVLSPQSSVLDAVFRLLARSEEHEVATGDKYERFLWEHSTASPPEDAARPVVSEYSQKLLAELRERAAQMGVPFIHKEAWPGGRVMAACLTHDVDAVSRGKLPRGIAVRDVRDVLAAAARGQLGDATSRVGQIARTASRPNPYWSFGRVSAMERERGFRSTYFVMAGRLHPEDAAYDPAEPRMRKLWRHLDDSGCEIALHGSFGTSTDGPSMKAQKEKLEGILGTKIAGHRNHVLRFRVPDSWIAHEQAGLSYDATLGFADHEGFRGGIAFPFHPYHVGEKRSMDLLEIPLALMDVTIHKYRHLRGERAWEAISRVLEETRGVGGLATLLWHNDTFYDPDYPGCGRLYERSLDWLVQSDAWVATCAEVDRWWRARSAVLIEPLPEGQTGWRIEAPQEIEGLTLRVTLPDPAVALHGSDLCDITRDGPDHLVKLGRLDTGTRIDLYW